MATLSHLDEANFPNFDQKFKTSKLRFGACAQILIVIERSKIWQIIYDSNDHEENVSRFHRRIMREDNLKFVGFFVVETSTSPRAEVFIEDLSR